MTPKLQYHIIEKEIGHVFRNKHLLQEALTHSSFANEHKIVQNKFNERLEFLGDSILNLVISEHIYKLYPEQPEGQLSKIRSGLVCENTLAIIGHKVHIGDYLLLGRGEDATGGRKRKSLLSDAVEALCGAVFLDSDFGITKNFILSLYSYADIDFYSFEGMKDYKGMLQRFLQSDNFEYRVKNISGPDHAPVFEIELLFDEKVLGSGSGKNKKTAEQEAAKKVLENLNEK